METGGEPPEQGPPFRRFADLMKRLVRWIGPSRMGLNGVTVASVFIAGDGPTRRLSTSSARLLFHPWSVHLGPASQAATWHGDASWSTVPYVAHS